VVSSSADTPTQADGSHLIKGVANADRVPHLAAELRTLFSAALEQAYPGIGIQPIIAQTGNPKFGDYQCNNAMALFGKLKGQVCAADLYSEAAMLTVHTT
jgi:Arginyl tRNA synthetase N terminal domain